MADASASRTTSEKIETLRSWIESCLANGMVFLGGAGVSTESGIPDFRSADGLYSQRNDYPYPPEVMISRPFFDAHPAEFYAYYCDRMLALGARVVGPGLAAQIVDRFLDTPYEGGRHQRRLDLIREIELTGLLDGGEGG